MIAEKVVEREIMTERVLSALTKIEKLGRVSPPWCRKFKAEEEVTGSEERLGIARGDARGIV